MHVSGSIAGLLLTRVTIQQPKQFKTTPKLPSKRKRGQQAQDSSHPAQDRPPSKRARTFQRAPEVQLEEAEQNFLTSAGDPLRTWVLNKRWPGEYFEPDQARKELLDRDSWLEAIMEQPPTPVVQYVERNGFKYPLPITKIGSLRRKQSQSDTSASGSSDQMKRESKSTAYRDSRYTAMLETKGSFLRDFGHQIPRTITDTCQQLLATDQTVPQNSLFREDLFSRSCWKIQDRNEAMIIQDISRLLVPSAMNLAIYGDTHLDCLVEGVNEAWTGSIPVEGPKPQPDYAVGFGRSAFTDQQLKKLGPLVGSVFDSSFFVATYRIFFPFLTCEVKCGAAALDIADRQNAHSMTIAVRSVVELYRAVKREKELDQVILAFSISHDHSAVRIYGHYAVINDGVPTFYRHSIKKFDFTSEEGMDKWTAYKFTKNVYDVWMPAHLQRICSAIDQLPSSLDFQVLEDPRVQSTAIGPTQDAGSLTSQMVQDDNELNPNPQTAALEPSVSKGMGQGAAKRAKKNRLTK